MSCLAPQALLNQTLAILRGTGLPLHLSSHNKYKGLRWGRGQAWHLDEVGGWLCCWPDWISSLAPLSSAMKSWNLFKGHPRGRTLWKSPRIIVFPYWVIILKRPKIYTLKEASILIPVSRTILWSIIIIKCVEEKITLREACMLIPQRRTVSTFCQSSSAWPLPLKLTPLIKTTSGFPRYFNR